MDVSWSFNAEQRAICHWRLPTVHVTPGNVLLD
jgi:hypothetical protein